MELHYRGFCRVLATPIVPPHRTASAILGSFRVKSVACRLHNVTRPACLQATNL